MPGRDGHSAKDQQGGGVVLRAPYAFTCEDELIKINGLNYWHVFFKMTGTADTGFKLNPAQTKAEAVDGTISGVGGSAVH
jgi:hypothetical protein